MERDPMPPKWILKFFQWFCHPRLRYHIEGDLLEEYGTNRFQKGKFKADILFIADVILLVRPAIIRPFTSESLNPAGMYKNYFKIGLRNLSRNKGYSIINIAGLALGMAVAMLNALYIWDEYSFNKSFDNYERIAQVAERGFDNNRGEEWIGTTMTYPLGAELISNYSQQFKRIARASWDAEYIIAHGQVSTSANGLYVDKVFPDIFSFDMVEGSRIALKDERSVFISTSLAKLLFGNNEAINQVLLIGNKTEVKVGGVFKDFPLSSKFYNVRFFGSWDLFVSENKWIGERAMNDWRNHFMKVYVELHEGNSFETISERIKPALKFDPRDQESAVKSNQQLFLYPMRDWHLYPTGNQNSRKEPSRMIRLIGMIGVFVLLLACINFMNLTTARSARRAKEVGIRKTIGSRKGQLVSQFFIESIMIVLFAFMVAMILVNLSLPSFNQIADKDLGIPWSNTTFWLACSAFVLLTGIIAGSYPALFLSSFSPIKTLKGNLSNGQLSALPRKVMVVFQFCISVILIIATIIVFQQIDFAKSRPVGYDREGLIMIRKKSRDFAGKYETLRNELKNTGKVIEVSESMGPITDVVSGNNGWDWDGKDPKMDESFATLSVSHLHGKTVGWHFISGRDFDISRASDSTGLVINETALKLMNLENPIGARVTWTWPRNNQKIDYTIIGVIQDVLMDSPYSPVEPTVFYVKGFNGTPDWINVRMNPTVGISEALPAIESVFKKIIPNVPFDYKFADETYGLKFAKEERIATLAMVFAALAIFISALGLLGLASFTAEQRTKEIGIRKVLGASVTTVWKLLSKDFMFLVLIACIIATPLAYYLLSTWLENYSYRTPISAWVFVSSSIGAVALTLIVVSYQAISAALMNPVKSLKSE